MTYELDLSKFEAWSGAVETLDRIRDEGKTDELEAMLEELYPDGMSETELNDLLWFDSDTVYSWLGIKTDEEPEEEEADRKTAKEAEEYYDFCTTFGMSCDGCPLRFMDGDCEENFRKWREEE